MNTKLTVLVYFCIFPFLTSGGITADALAVVGPPERETELRWIKEDQAQTLVGHRQPITAIALSPDNTLLAVGDDANRTVNIWNVQTGVRRQQIRWRFPVMALAFAPDASTLLGLDVEKTIVVWELHLGQSTFQTNAGSSRRTEASRF